MTPLPQVDCNGCGACCMHVGYPPLVSLPGDPEWDRLPIDLQLEIEIAQQREPDIDRPCIWLDMETRRCRHYDLRPSVCVKFPVGGLSCLSFRSARGIDPCP